MSQNRDLRSSRNQVNYSNHLINRSGNPNSISMTFLPINSNDISFGNTTPEKKTNTLTQTLNQSVDNIVGQSVRKQKLEELSDEFEQPMEDQNRR